MEQENRNNKKSEPTYSTRVRAGKRRTYFIDVRPTKYNEYYLTITESKKKNDDTYEKHKIFVYREDFNKFLAALTDTINHIKTDLMPGVDFDQFDRKDYNDNKEYSENKEYNDNNKEYTNESDNTSNEDVVEERQEQPAPAPQASNDGTPSTPVSDEDLKW